MHATARRTMLLAGVEAIVTMPSSRTAAGPSMMQLTMSSGSSGRSETCSSSNSLGMCRDTSFMVILGSNRGYSSGILVRKQS